MSKPKLLCKASLKRLVKESGEETLSPKIKDVVFWYDELNRMIFGDKLPDLDSILLRRRYSVSGEASAWQYGPDDNLVWKTHYTMSLHNKFKSLKHLLSVIAHEMVHIWQYEIHGKMNHGKTFKQWSDKITKHGLVFGERL